MRDVTTMRNAIALTLQALRAVDRYGASAKGEQYRGYKSIGAGDGDTTHMDLIRARQLLTAYGEPSDEESPMDPKVIRRARATAHPDRHGGDRRTWDLVEQAITVLT